MLVEDTRSKSFFDDPKEFSFGRYKYEQATSYLYESSNPSKVVAKTSKAKGTPRIVFDILANISWISFCVCVILLNHPNFSSETNNILFRTSWACLIIYLLILLFRPKKTENNLSYKIDLAKLYLDSNYVLSNIIAGNKKAFFSGELFHHLRGVEISNIGDKVILSDFYDNPIVELKIIAVDILPFKALSTDDAGLDGHKKSRKWKRVFNKILNKELSNYYAQEELNGQPVFLSMRPLQVEQGIRLPYSDLSIGINSALITDDFKIVREIFETVKIYNQTYEQWIKSALDLLSKVMPKEDAKTDINVMLSHVTGKNKAQIFAFPESELNEYELKKLSDFLIRRAKGEPIAYILGEKEFWSLLLNVSEGTLIPRPDTEIIVEKALQIALEKLEENPPHFRILDLGTGTGAIALALASELSLICQKKAIQLDVIGVDLMPEVVKLAQSNAEKNQLKVQFLQSRWFENVEGQFDIIVSNPPYIDETDEHLFQGDVRFEPRSALVAGENGLADLRHLIEYAPGHLKDNGYLLLEHGWKQGEEVRSIFWQNHWQGVATIRDYGDNERVTLGYWKR